MSDEVDDLLRRTMATLDRQVPDGYVDTLVSRALVRLDDPALGEPLDPQGDEPHVPHDEGAPPASSSPGWKAVALSEPAQPPSGPTLEVVDERSEIAGGGAPDGFAGGAGGHPRGIDELARERAAREARAARTRQASDPAPAAAATDQAAVMPGRRAPSNRRPIVAVVGLGLAAAVGATIFVGTRDKTASAPELVARGRDLSEAHATNSAPVGAEPKATASETAAGSAVTTPEPAPAEAHAGSAARGDQITEAEKPAGNVAQVARPAVPAVEQGAALGKIAKKPTATKGRGKGAFTDEPTKFTDEPTKFKNRPPEDTPGEGKPGGSAPWAGKPAIGKPTGHDGEPSSGKSSKQGIRASNGDKPELDQPSLSSDAIKRGMTAVDGKAKACFAGTQGTATVQLTVAPSGRVQKATVTGLFAGTPTGACVEQAVRAATFPPFDGEPQSFAYDYLLSN